MNSPQHTRRQHNHGRAAFRILFSRATVSVVLILSALGGSLVVYRFLASFKQPPPEREVTEKTWNIEVYDVERHDLIEVISSFGTARPDREVVVAAQVSGEIVATHPDLRIGRAVVASGVEVGKSGKSLRTAGDVLVYIDPRAWQERVIQARSRIDEGAAEVVRLEQEQANTERLLRKAREDYSAKQKAYARVEQALAREAATENQLNEAELELRQYEDAVLQHDAKSRILPLRLKSARLTLGTLGAALKLAELDLQNTTVKPPFDGVLSDVMVELGQIVQAGTPLVRLTDLSIVEIPVPLPLSDFLKIEPEVAAGRFPQVSLSETETAEPRWTGRVVRVAPEADERTRTVQVFVRVDNEESQSPLLPGSFVHARIEGPMLEDSMVVPRDAVIDGRVYVAGESGVEQRQVTAGLTLESLVVIEQGLAAGEEVILTNLDMLQPGARIQIRVHRTLDDELNRQRVPTLQRRLAGDTDATAGTPN